MSNNDNKIDDKNRNVPVLRFEGFTDPWVQCKLNNFVEFYSGQTYSPADVQEVGTLILRSSNINDGKIIDADNVYINSEKINSPNVQTGDIIVVVRNGSRSLLGKHAQILQESPKTVIGAFMTGIRSKSPSFVNALLDTTNFYRQISNNLGATINQITNYMFDRMNFIIPTISEQNKIGELISTLNKIITLEQEKLEHLTDISNYLSSKLFPKKSMVSPVLRKIQKSEDWKKHQLGEYGESFGGLTGKIKNDFGHGEAKYITYKNIFDNIFVDSNQLDATPIDHKQNKVLFGDTLFTLSSEIPEEVGMSSVCLLEIEELYVNSFSFGYRLNPDKEVNYLYLAYYFRSVEFRDKMRILAQGISRYNISQQQVMNLYILLPDIEEQKFVGEVLNTNNQYIKLQNKKIKKLKTLRQFLLQNLFI